MHNKFFNALFLMFLFVSINNSPMEREKGLLKRTVEQVYSQVIDNETSEISITELMSTEPIEKELKKVICKYPDCFKQVPKNSLKQHVYRNHGRGAEKITCHYNGCKALLCRYGLTKHIRQFHESKKIPCTHEGCNEAILPESLKKHMKTHDAKNQEFHICTTCKEEKTSFYAMRFHLQNQHKLVAPWRNYYIVESRPV